jgi:hypothetical protein
MPIIVMGYFDSAIAIDPFGSRLSVPTSDASPVSFTCICPPF